MQGLILPYQNEHFSEYRTKSVQEFRFELSQGIRSQIFFATFVKNIETLMALIVPMSRCKFYMNYGTKMLLCLPEGPGV